MTLIWYITNFYSNLVMNLVKDGGEGREVLFIISQIFKNFKSAAFFSILLTRPAFRVFVFWQFWTPQKLRPGFRREKVCIPVRSSGPDIADATRTVLGSPGFCPANLKASWASLCTVGGRPGFPGGRRRSETRVWESSDFLVSPPYNGHHDLSRENLNISTFRNSL